MAKKEQENKGPQGSADKRYFKIDGISSRGEILSGTVVSDKMKHTVIVERDVIKYISKYKKYARAHSRIVAHNPPSINAKVGDIVTIAETRKISKTKAWMVVEVTGKEGVSS